MTQQRRYYVLIASLVLSFGTHESFAYDYIGGVTIHEVGISNPECATISFDSCALCGTRDTSLCEPDNECAYSEYPHQYYKDGQYLKSGDHSEPGYYLCTAGSGWVHYEVEPTSCDSTTCVPGEWGNYDAVSQVMQNAWCEQGPGGQYCHRESTYRCKKNYYCLDAGGSSICRGNQCVLCSNSPDQLANEELEPSGEYCPGYTIGAGATGEDECFILAYGGSHYQSGYHDASGVYKFINDCFYTY